MPTAIELTDAPNHGCYVDGHWGWRAIGHMVEQFSGVAYVLDDEDEALLGAFMAGDDATNLDAMTWLADECERLLNDALPAGTVAHWHDGEFFLSPMCEDGACDDETCAHWDC